MVSSGLEEFHTSQAHTIGCIHFAAHVRFDVIFQAQVPKAGASLIFGAATGPAMMPAPVRVRAAAVEVALQLFPARPRAAKQSRHDRLFACLAGRQ